MFAVVIAVAAAGLAALPRLLDSSRRHAALELVHDFVTETAVTDSTPRLGELLSTGTRLMRAGPVEMHILRRRGDGATCTVTRLMDTEDGFRVTPRVDGALDGRAARTEPGRAAARAAAHQGSRGARWLRERGYVDAMLVAIPPAAGPPATLIVTDRLGETATFTEEDLTLLQTIAGHSPSRTNTRIVERLRYDANHDALTGLANRAVLFSDQMGLAVPHDSRCHAAGPRPIQGSQRHPRPSRR